VAFLNARGNGRRHNDRKIDGGSQRAAIFARQTDRLETARRRFFQREKNVWRVAAGGYTEGDVSALAKRLNLPSENLIKAVIVADSSEQGGIGREGNGRQRTALENEAADKFGRKVLSIGSAATVAKKKQLPAVAKAIADRRSGLDDNRATFASESVSQIGSIAQSGDDVGESGVGGHGTVLRIACLRR